MAKDPGSGLTDKQKCFCEQYLLDFNATAAYIRAGYTGKAAEVNASRLLTNDKVQAYLAVLRSRVTERAEVTLEKTVREIARIAFSNITTALTFNESGVVFRDSETLPEDVTAAIESVSFSESETKGGINRRCSLKFHNKTAALTLLADYFGIRDDFNKARATLTRYGLALVQDPTAPSGWRVEEYAPNGSNPPS